jgi:hypothetical protein
MGSVWTGVSFVHEFMIISASFVFLDECDGSKYHSSMYFSTSLLGLYVILSCYPKNLHLLSS